MTDKIVVLCTCASPEEGERVARAIVEARLAACVNMIPSARSIYRWKGEIESAEECLLVIKSSRGQFDALRARIAELHSYEVPEVLALQVVDGAPDYLDWLSRSLAGGSAE